MSTSTSTFTSDGYALDHHEIFEDVYATQKALVDHLVHHHGKSAISKQSKDSLIEMHERIHARQAMEANQWWSGFRNHYDTERLTDKGGKGNYVYTVHTHVAVGAEDLRGYAVPDLDKPLSTQEAAALKAVIEADFEALEQNVRAMAQAEKESRRKEVAEEWDKKATKVNQYADKRAKLYETFRQSIADLRDKATADGITLPTAITLDQGLPTVNGRKEALDACTREVDAALQQALTTAKRQKAAALRTVALSRITPAARTVLDGIPDAQTLMVEAAKEHAAQAIEA